jgi:hypothetical protein
MSLIELTAVVPRLPPVIDGVGDYALSLARELRERFEINTHFIVGDPSWLGEETVEHFPVTKLTERTEARLRETLPRQQSSRVLLHYGGYAYAQRGCPDWLVEALTNWRAEREGRILITLFHELYASGPPWTSSFWLSPRQRNLTEQLARLSDSCHTSLAFYSGMLQQMGARAQSLPVFSSVGEPSQLPKPLSSRSRRLIVFGTPGRRLQVYRRSAGDLNPICRELGIEEIWDIGGDIDLEPARYLDVPLVRCGKMPGPEVCDIFLDSIAGVIDYPADMLGKSTIFAAYCAHRMIPLVAGYNDARPADGLVAGVEYRLLHDADGLSLSLGQRLADNAFDWYQDHRLVAHATRLAASLEPDGSSAQKHLVHA